MSRLWAAFLLLGLLSFVGLVGAQTPTSLSASTRPDEAPRLGRELTLPPLPPEYLTQEVEGITIAYHPSARERVRLIAEEATALRRRLSEELGTPVLDEVSVRVAVGPSDVARILPEGVVPGREVIALSEASVLVLALPSAPTSTDRVLAGFRRGMTFLALDEAAGASTLPRWFRLGYALRLAGHGSLERSRALWWASVERKVVPVVDLDFYLRDGAHDSVAAAESADFVAYLSDGERAEAFAHLMRRCRSGESFEAAVTQAYQADLASLERAWRRDLAQHRTFVPILGGSLALWALLAVGVVVMRRRRERVVEPPPPTRPRRRRRRARKLRVPVGAVEAAEADVPKVSHDGRWHTLH